MFRIFRKISKLLRVLFVIVKLAPGHALFPLCIAPARGSHAVASRTLFVREPQNLAVCGVRPGRRGLHEQWP